MSSKKNLLTIVLSLLLLGIGVFVIVYGGMTLTKDIGKSNQVVSKEKAQQTLQDTYNDITVKKNKPRKALVDIKKSSVKDSLPDISKFSVQVQNSTTEFIEIFSSPEKAGPRKDGWLIEIAKDFNNAGIKVKGLLNSLIIYNQIYLF
ncbi:hypothetical protein [Halanaerobacter jeridensis]|uniref:Preprotein translocase subunit SecF n=1 Tax=Halanaerobacter jeridensis TaxID=706427 RepID=A0A939BQX2_9FIRM|nr:hypothetical protein [Halanaerobacter jeridensis]MBM7556794.1 preprotein translocase subunit SecF [Halanaerobacter jeridensis]